MNPFVVYLCALPVVAEAWRMHLHKRIWIELEEKYGSEALNFGNHPKQNLVKGRRTVEDERRWWCEYLSKKHEECAKLSGSDKLLCDVFKMIGRKIVQLRMVSINRSLSRAVASLRVKGIVEGEILSKKLEQDVSCVSLNIMFSSFGLVF